MIINKTPHPVDIVTYKGELIKSFPKAVTPARIILDISKCAPIDSIPITKTTFKHVVGLPEESKGTYYIVSQMVKNYLVDRKDLLVPTDMKRDEDRNIIGVCSLGC